MKPDKFRIILNLKLIILALVISFIGILCLIYSIIPIENFEIGQTILREVGGLLLISGTISILFDVFIKRNIIDEIMTRLKIKEDISKTGILRTTDSFKEIYQEEWDIFFKSVKNLDIFISYGKRWRTDNINNLEKISSKKGVQFRIILPDCKDDNVLKVLATRYEKTDDVIKKNINEAIDFFINFKKDKGANIEIYLFPEPPLYSIYRFDDKLIFSLYPHRYVPPPSFVCEYGGTLYDYFSEDFNYMIEKSKIIK